MDLENLWNPGVRSALTFKTLKYQPEFPQRFGSLEDAQTFCRSFFKWYNLEHRHSGIAMLNARYPSP
ncbi:MAG: transposase [Magnetococcales bacterium]|nr:transposase [Magnetococcales bacterium]